MVQDLLIIQRDKKFSVLMEPDNSSPTSEIITGSYSETARSNDDIYKPEMQINTNFY
jgi:hypothetical protein